MNRGKMPKSICAIILTLAIFVAQIPSAPFFVYASGGPTVTIDNCGSRLNTVISDISTPTYQWQIADSVDGVFANITDATNEYYDITAQDEGKYIRVIANGTTSEPVGPIGKLVTMDIAKGSISLGSSYSGKDSSGATVSGTHQASNIYVIVQSNREVMTTNRVDFKDHLLDKPFDVTLDGLNMGQNPTNHNQAPGSSGSNTPTGGAIYIPATESAVKKVTLRLKNENIIRHIEYYNAGDTSEPKSIRSSLKITDINGDGASDGGSLYVPVKLSTDEIDAFVQTKTNYNHWNAGIGGLDSSSLMQNFTIAGGKIQVVTTLGDNCTAIGAGGNGYCQMEISGGEVIAHCNGTGAAIGGGIGWQAQGGRSNVLISGGKVYAKNHSRIETTKDGQKAIVGGVAIGSGSSFFAAGSEGQVTITGGTVEAYGTFGNGIGGGNSSSSTGGKATINISGGNVTATSIGGGNSRTGSGGNATVTIEGTANVTLSGGIGGGNSESGKGGDATVTVKNGTMNCGGVIGGGNGGNTGNGGTAEIHVSGGTLTSTSIGGGVGSVGGHGGAAEIDISGGVIKTGSIGGGNTLNTTNGKLGYAQAVISGGDISGQFLMAAGGTEACSFTMTGGILHGVNTKDTTKYQYAQENGAAVYMDDPNGVAVLSGGSIENCSALNGGAVYMTNGTFTISGEGSIKNCEAEGNGGAVYLGGGTLNVQGGSIQSNSSANGGAAFVNGGNVVVTGGEVSNNTAINSGGGIAVNNGNYTMTGGKVDNNMAEQGYGGGIYVSADGEDVTVDVRSGSVSGNQAQQSGGALSVIGSASGTEDINVQIGVDKEHFDNEGNLLANCEHGIGEEHAFDCPVLVGNIAEQSGGAIYVTGSTKTKLNIYCLEESSSVASGENGQSNFMKMEGGVVTITTSDSMEKNNEGNQTARYGNTKIQSTIYVTGGQMDIWGEMTNPRIGEVITVDIEKEGDYFDDHRDKQYEGDERKYYKLLYYENFTDPVTGVTTGQYKAIEVEAGEFETISGNIYSHPGYDIVGWNTDADGKDDYDQGENPLDQTLGWYDVGEKYKFDGNPIGDLVIYAIWNANGYTVVYNPNTSTYTGKMDSQVFKYDVAAKLNKNAYGRVGYVFVGWARNPEGTGEVYADEQVVTNLTTEKGEVVYLYAIWEECNHDSQQHEYTYTVINNGATLQRTCKCNNYSETIALAAENVVYDRNEHPVGEKCSSSWRLPITYMKDDVSMNEDELPVNAGTYTASVTAGGKTAKVTYVIEKAEQPAPVKPIIYEAAIDQKGNASILQIKKITASPLSVEDSTNPSYDSTYDSYDEYQVVYYDGDTKCETEWVKGTLIEGGFAAQFNLEVALTNYYIYARYSEGTNYKASLTTSADTVYFFEGDVEVYVSRGDGVKYSLNVADGSSVQNGIMLNIGTEEGYYFSKNYTVTMSYVLQSGGEEPKLVVEQKFERYQITQVPPKSKITINLPNANKAVSIASNITEKQVFGQVTISQAIISRDSAYTAYFEVSNYDKNEYKPLELEFSANLPVGTKIIMVDKATKTYYWYVLDSEACNIVLQDFTRMGAEQDYVEVDGKLQLQVVVDFSECANLITADTLTTSLIANKQTDSRAIDAAVHPLTQLRNASTFELQTSGEGLVKNVQLKYGASQGVVSKWDERHMALVLTPRGSLPSDAHLEYYDGIRTSVAYKNSSGDFVLPLSELATKDVSITLISGVFPETSIEYTFDVQWIMAKAIAASSPMNGNVAAETSISFVSVPVKVPSVKVTGNDRLYNTSQEVLTTVEWANIPPGNSVTLTLMRKNQRGTYVNTAWEKEINTQDGTSLEVAVPLGGQTAGSYCLQVTVMNGLVKETESYYYFVVE